MVKQLALLVALSILVVSCGNCDEVADNVVDIDQTVKEVESILSEDPKLPRLTRGEIITLIEEVRSGKDLMVVLPQQLNTTLEEMYTARPVTQIITDNGQLVNSNNGSEVIVTTTKRPKRRRKPIRPIYKHTTPHSPVIELTTSEPANVAVNDNNEVSTVKTSTTTDKFSQFDQASFIEEWQPKFYITPKPSEKPIGTITTTTTTTAPIPQTDKPDITGAVESLSPDMKDLLSSFGLLSTPSTPVVTTTQPTFMIKSMTPSVDPSSYSRFKPLPNVYDGMSPDMKSFLASYGLLDIRKSKAVKLPTEDPFDTLPHQDVLDDLGLRKIKKLNHVFNPSSVSKNNTEELNKVNKILMKLRQFSEGNVTNMSEDEVDELLLLENNTRLAAGEDPVDNLQLLKNKIEVKRQQPNDTDITTTTTTTTEMTLNDQRQEAEEEDNEEEETETITTDSLPSGTDVSTETSLSVSDLEDSFGGGPSTRRPNGFYFLLDWNSFLKVGVDGEPRQVNLNFSPKVGDPRNFLSVTVP